MSSNCPALQNIRENVLSKLLFEGLWPLYLQNNAVNHTSQTKNNPQYFVWGRDFLYVCRTIISITTRLTQFEFNMSLIRSLMAACSPMVSTSYTLRVYYRRQSSETLPKSFRFTTILTLLNSGLNSEKSQEFF